MKLGLLTKESPFFGVLNRHTAVVAEAAVQMRELLRSFDRLPERVRGLGQLREKGRQLQQEMTHSLSKAFVTPIDREDLHLLSSSLDGVLGYIEGTADKVQLYRITASNELVLRQADVLVNITAVLVEGFEGLARFDDCTPLWQKVKDLEREGDRLVAEAIASLFDSALPVIQVIKWKEVHEDMEESIDRCEDVFDGLETVIIKHA